MSFTRYYHSCVGRCNRPQSPARRTGHHTANVVTASFPPLSTLCPPQHLRNDLLLIGVSRAWILPSVYGTFLAYYLFQRKYACIVRLPAPPPLVFSANLRLHTEASFTTTRKLLKQHREHFHPHKSNDIDSHAAFPDSISP